MSKILILTILCFIGVSESYAKPTCSTKLETKYIRGISMSELFKPEEPVKAEVGYYSCHSVKRNDIVLVSIANRKDPIIKLVRVIPGDSFELRAHKAGFHLYVNNAQLRTPKGRPYFFTSNAKMLKLYEESFKKKMPLETYFVLGTEPEGSFDSSRFGPIKKEQIVARVNQRAN